MAKRLMLPVLNRHAGGICPFFAAENYNLFPLAVLPSFLSPLPHVLVCVVPSSEVPPPPRSRKV